MLSPVFDIPHDAARARREHAAWHVFRPLARRAAVAASLLGLTLLAACASSDGIAPQAKRIDAESLGLAVGNGTVAAKPPWASDTWWRAFNSADLNQLIERALTEQPSLRVAQARLASAAALVARGESVLMPTVQGSATATRERFTATGVFPPPLGGATFTPADAQLTASWEFDWFGKHRAALDAALGAQAAARADLQAARVLLASNIAQAYVQLARLQSLHGLANQALALRKTMLGLVRQRVQAGLDSGIELRLSEGSLPELSLQIAQVDEEIALVRHQLAELTAQPPQALETLKASLPNAADPAEFNASASGAPRSNTFALPSKIPADLLGRRADVMAAKWRVESASNSAANAKAEFYPNLNLVAFVGLSSLGVDTLLRSASQQYGAGPALSLPIFDGGRLRANLRSKTADVDTSIETYNSTVLHAVHDAADQLASLQSVAQQINFQRQALSTAQASHQLALERASAGLTNRLAPLATEMLVLNQRRTVIDLDARWHTTHIALIRALGGGARIDTSDSGASE